MITMGKTEYLPLERVVLDVPDGGHVTVRDGQGHHYVDEPVPPGGELEFSVGGALGTHNVTLQDQQGRLLESAAFRVDCRTRIDDTDGRFRRLFQMAHDTMYNGWTSGYTKSVRINDKLYKYFKVWLRDHVHSMKGLKYFVGDLRSGIDLYADWQREDGMIWDKVKEQFHSNAQNWFDVTFARGDFIRKVPGHPKRRFCRVPVENDVEWLFLEGLYFTWKATGDDKWMASLLDNAIRACEYATSDEYRWSEKFALLKRGYTIDTWDFLSQYDQNLGIGRNMIVDPDRTVFGVFHGDNTGFAVGCHYLAEMLRHAGRQAEAERFDRLGDELMERLTELAWNGEFYAHHVSEDPSFERDFGDTNESAQVSLSNAYALNRGLPHDKCVAIIESYRRIRREMPDSSPGEFYLIYPPFEKGFGRHSKWHYMNGGVSTITAGELARGAFEHGYEHYGVDILDRVRGWGEKHRDHLHCVLRGKMPELKGRTFHPLDLREQANCDFRGDVEGEVTGWAGDGDNDMRNLPVGRQTFRTVEFDVIDPARNGRRACIGLSSKSGYADRAAVSVGRECRSLYLLHAASGGGLIGWMTLRYADGEEQVHYVQNGRQVGNWFMPPAPEETLGREPLCLAWSGENGKYQNVGVWACAVDNPRPDCELSELKFTAARNGATWWIVAVSLGEERALLPVSDVSYGIPDMWGAGSIIYALVEGIAGVVDEGAAFDRARISPRWAAAGVDEADVTIKYPASDGYVAYRYSAGDKALRVEVTGSAGETTLRCLLPEGRAAAQVTVDGAPVEFRTETVEDSRYAAVELAGPEAHTVDVILQKK